MKLVTVLKAKDEDLTTTIIITVESKNLIRNEVYKKRDYLVDDVHAALKNKYFASAIKIK
jgi:hypothetical protein